MFNNLRHCNIKVIPLINTSKAFELELIFLLFKTRIIIKSITSVLFGNNSTIRNANLNFRIET